MRTRSPGQRATVESYSQLQLAYDFFNEKLFEACLPGALITMQRQGRTLGYTSFERFVNEAGERIDEIALNPVFIPARPIEDVLSTLVHEMAHQWRYRNGDPGRRCYHDKVWAQKMSDLGLMPSDTGRPGGRRTGERMSHYVVEGGPFIRVARELLRNKSIISWYDRFPGTSSKAYVYGTEQGGGPDELDHADEPDGSGGQAGLQVEPRGGAPGSREALQQDHPPLATMTRPPVEVKIQSHVVSPQPAAAKPMNRSNRVRYGCPKCKTKLWGKPGVSAQCVPCATPFKPDES